MLEELTEDRQRPLPSSEVERTKKAKKHLQRGIFCDIAVSKRNSTREFLSKRQSDPRPKQPLGEKEETMADESTSGQPKTLEMRVAELEDKLSKIHITEDEMKAYQKVSSLVGQQAQPSLSPQVCVLNCIARCIISNCITTACIHQTCIYECTCGPCSCVAQSKAPGGGFGTLGS